MSTDRIAQFKTFFIEEPLLTFGNDQKYIDPKMGLISYGPCLYKNRKIISSSIKLGIIGDDITINLTKNLLNKCQKIIYGKTENPNFYPTFPGFTRIFGSDLLVLDECIEKIEEDEINDCINNISTDKNTKNLANLIVDKISNIKGREPRPHVVIIAIPEKIIDYLNIKGEESLIKSDLRCMIKAKAMVLGISTQIIRPTTLKVKIKDSDNILQHESTIAWNLCTALFYKAEGYPWKIADMPIGTCYIGISFYRIKAGTRLSIGSSLAQIFTHTGQGLVLQGAKTIRDKKSRIVHLTKKDSYKLMNDALDLYKKQMGKYPIRIVVHKSSKYYPDELEGFEEASNFIKEKDFIAIESRGIRFMRREGTFPPIRGTVIQIAEKDYVIYTKGWIPLYEMYPGLRVPTPIEIVEHYGSTPIDTVCKEILALTKMNWNSADFCIREPVTIAYSRNVGKILAYVPEEAYIRPEYYYYM